MSPTLASALIAPGLKVIFKRDSIWTVMRSDDESKPISYTLEANPYRAALIEFAKNRGYLTLQPTGANENSKRPACRRSAKTKKKRNASCSSMAVNQSPIAISKRFFRLSPTPIPKQPGYIMTERWTGIVPRGGHTFIDRQGGGGFVPTGFQFQNAEGRSAHGFNFSNPNTGGGTQKYEKCDTCPGGYRKSAN